jgi:3,4-dihydroxy 2-butanone 4-phosphate synthase / GTP cyclohydrolase II
MHVAFVYNGVGDGKNVLTRLHKPNIVKDLFTGQARMQIVLNHFKNAGRGVLVYLRDGAAGVPVEPVGEQKSAEADRNRQWREVGVGAQILRDLGVTSIRHLTSSVHDYKGLSGFGIEIVSNEKLEGSCVVIPECSAGPYPESRDSGLTLRVSRNDVQNICASADSALVCQQFP